MPKVLYKPPSAVFGTSWMTAFLKGAIARVKSRKVELGLGVRVTVAAFGALAVAMALGLKLPLWAVLTSLIVTQMSVGRSLKATRDYLVGTVGGAIYGGAVAVLIPHSGEGALLAVLVAWGIASVGIGAISLSEVFLAKNTLDAGDFGYGLLYGGIGTGLVIGSWWSSAIVERP